MTNEIKWDTSAIANKIHTTDKWEQQTDLKIDGVGIVDVFGSPDIKLPTNKTHQVRKVLIEEVNAITGETRQFQSSLLLKGGAHPELVEQVEGNTIIDNDLKETHGWMTLHPDEVSILFPPPEISSDKNNKTIRIWDDCYIVKIYGKNRDYTILPAIIKVGLPFLATECESEDLDPDDDISQMTNHFGSVLVYKDPNGFSKKNDMIKMVYIAGFGWYQYIKEIQLESVTLIPVE